MKQFEYRPSRRFEDDAEESLHRLALICRYRPIFPSLSYLYLERTWPVSLSVASLLFSPSIRTLAIDCVRGSTQSWSKMTARQQDHLCAQILIRHCPAIRQFLFRYSGPAQRREYDTFNAMFRALHDLESINFFFWYSDGHGKAGIPEIQRCQWLQTISDLSHARHLFFSVDKICDYQLSMTHLAGFRGLEQLTLQGRPSVMFEVLKFLKSPKLRAVSLNSGESFLTESDVHGYQRSIGFLASRASHTLTSLRLQGMAGRVLAS